jgi:hypothetical protein
VFIDPTDILLIWDPYYSRHTRQRADSGEQMTFVEAVFSFVFGDGNPNERFEVCACVCVRVCVCVWRLAAHRAVCREGCARLSRSGTQAPSGVPVQVPDSGVAIVAQRLQHSNRLC